MKSFQITVAIEESLHTFEETSENSGAGGKKILQFAWTNVYQNGDIYFTISVCLISLSNIILKEKIAQKA